MINTIKQTKTPIFPEILWNLPERAKTSGKLTVIGGNQNSFRAPIAITEAARAENIQTIRLILPDSLEKLLPKNDHTTFAPSNPSGSFSQTATAILNEAVSTADYTIIAGDLSDNAETLQLFERLLKNTDKPLIIASQALSLADLDKNQTLLIPFPDLIKLLKTNYYPKPLFISQPLTQALDTLRKFTITYPLVTIATTHQNTYIVSSGGKISTTPLSETAYTPLTLYRGTLAAKIAMLNLHNPAKPFESATTAILCGENSKNQNILCDKKH